MRFSRVKLLAGIALVALSVAAVVQSVREIVLWETGQRRYAEQHPLDLPIRFAGREITVADDQPTAAVNDEVGHEGALQIRMDGQPLGAPSRALVRRGRTDLGRYHLWLDASLFEDRTTGRRTLWIARRIQPRGTIRPKFEVVTVDEDATVRTRLYRTTQLGGSYPLFRATQFVRNGTSSAIPLSMVEALYFWPIIFVFPIGSFVWGIRLIRRSRPDPSPPVRPSEGPGR